MTKFRVGSIGLGGISNGVHLPGIANCPDLELVALCDIDAQALARAQARYGIDDAHCFTDYRDLIACPDVDAVDISTPNDVHMPIAMAAVAAGKPYCLEKPVTLSAQQALQLRDATAQKGLPNMVCFSYRFKSAARYARDLIARGALGKLYHVDMQYFQAWGLPDHHANLVWRFVKERTGTGALGDLGCHALDLVRFVTGQEYTRVVGHLGTYVTERERPEGGRGPVDVDDFSNYMADMSAGASASFQITRFAYGRGNYQRMEIYGEKGALVYSLDRQEGVDELEACIGEVYGNGHTYVPLPIPARYATDQMQAFADVLAGRGDGLSATIQDGLANQLTVDAIVASAEQGRWLAL
ncbi:MAG: Gfo/Idh/MocA family protein [Christensenellales bacterium]